MAMRNLRILPTNILIYSSLVLSFILLGCHKDNNELGWEIDPEYSFSLTRGANNYSATTGRESFETVDYMRIYEVFGKRKDMYSLTELAKNKLVFETQEKSFIKTFLVAAREDISPIEECTRNESINKYHVVMFNNKKRVAGCFIFVTCKVGEEKYGKIIPYQKGSSFYNNKALLPIFDKILREK